MKLLSKFFLIFSCSIAFCAAPWDLDPNARELLQAQIEAKHQKRAAEAEARGAPSYLVDFHKAYLNFGADTCLFCQNPLVDKDLVEKFTQAKFLKRPSERDMTKIGHCFGITLFFTKYLLAHPQIRANTCAEILAEVTNDPSFKQAVHAFSVTSHVDYTLEGLKLPICLDSAAMKKYLQVLIEEDLADHFALPFPKTFDCVDIYATLEKVPNKLVVISYKIAENSYHCIAVSTQSDKLLIFDPNTGLYEFPDLETLSRCSAKVLKGSEFCWLATFPFPGQPKDEPSDA